LIAAQFGTSFCSLSVATLQIHSSTDWNRCKNVLGCHFW